MSKEPSTATCIDPDTDGQLGADRVADYLLEHPDFFLDREDLLAELSLPHASGDAVSLLERQISILRKRGIDARRQLGSLLENSRSNDELFNSVRAIVLDLARAGSIADIAEAVQGTLGKLPHIDACTLVLAQAPEQQTLPPSVRCESPERLQQDFRDVYRLQQSLCGSIRPEQLEYLFAPISPPIHSAVICPAIADGEILALLAFGAHAPDYFTIHLDTLFLDFIGHVLGAVLERLRKARTPS